MMCSVIDLNYAPRETRKNVLASFQPSREHHLVSGEPILLQDCLDLVGNTSADGLVSLWA
jgi:hypothetical protein